ncbi:Asp-tRNA(Asn)/Glu-tRNA(Gln) amidotransferase subunit GatA [Candidatus Peregrinibacteria bacterium]|nr:Asp-tRNA(Asn)/Glu-tRNA(Gln) amidotransferase subunit GatA [Candidatus Peregrinibacteria bacterium]
MSQLDQLTLKKAAEGIRSGEFKPSELTKSLLERIKRINPDVNSYLTVTEEQAMEAASRADVRASKGELIGLLDGIPAGVKDIFNTKGVRSTSASKILDNFIPPYDATSVLRLKNQGMIMLGKTNTDEFACGGSTEYSAYGVTKNPWNYECVAGGSSGGSAAAVAAGLGYYALGSDTGGSIRQPASFCGVTGVKVTYGRVSRSGVTAMASSLDTIGAFARTVEDAAIVIGAMAGNDEKDSTTPDVVVPDYLSSLENDLAGKTIGVPSEYFSEGLDSEVEAKIREALKVYESLGCKIKEVSLPYTKYAVAIYYIIMPAELSANLSRMDGIRFGIKPDGEVEDILDQYYKTRNQGFGDEVKRRILTGTYVLSAGYFDAYYKKAQKVRTLIIEDFAKVFQDVDVLMTPVAPTPAFKIGANTSDPLSMYLQDSYTIPASVAGLAGVSIPCGFSSAGLPIGLQIIGPQFSESEIFNFGHRYQMETDWHEKRPNV